MSETETEYPMKREPTIGDCIAEIDRELAMRRHWYPRWVDAGKVTQYDARWQYGALLKARLYLTALHNCGLADRCTADVRAVNVPKVTPEGGDGARADRD